jgi:hypothetical protein
MTTLPAAPATVATATPARPRRHGGRPTRLLRVQLPEAAGFSMVFRAVWPPALVVLALAPVVAAGAASTVDPVVTAANLAVLALVPSAGVLTWLSTRKARLL